MWSKGFGLGVSLIGRVGKSAKDFVEDQRVQRAQELGNKAGDAVDLYQKGQKGFEIYQEQQEERQRREREYHARYELDRLNRELGQLQAERIALVEEMSHDKIAVPDNAADKREKMRRVERKKWLDSRIQTLRELIQIETRRLRSPEG